MAYYEKELIYMTIIKYVKNHIEFAEAKKSMDKARKLMEEHKYDKDPTLFKAYSMSVLANAMKCMSIKLH